MKIYTKAGDKGLTGLIGGTRVPKSAPRIAAYGEVDELNAVLGLTRADTAHVVIQKSLIEIQTTLFVLGSQLASQKPDPKLEVVTAKHVDILERQIDAMTENLPPLKNFILPGGSSLGATVHLARGICRRVERQAVALDQTQPVEEEIIQYLNRLSDFLFMLARFINKQQGVSEVIWQGIDR